jgi:hypothetical protein
MLKQAAAGTPAASQPSVTITGPGVVRDANGPAPSSAPAAPAPEPAAPPVFQ